jgi:hypothetical protein
MLFEPAALGDTKQNIGFPIEFKEAVPKTEVLEQPYLLYHKKAGETS